ncbi:MAG: class I SAM-dependent methyltransferase [Candidatus Bathyarchaeia archaeon]
MADASTFRRALRSLRSRLRNFAVDAEDYVAAKRGKLDECNPPRRLRRLVGTEDVFSEVGEEFLKYFKDLCGLKPDERVLDVGCGSGRIACVLARYLNGQGSYEGFDIVREAIDWDRKVISAKFPNFHFQLSDIYNKSYNPKGKVTASEYRFPYADETFDFVFLTSVFTHMLPPDREHYVSEIHRVLKPGGRCLATAFLLNEESLRLSETVKETYIKFPFQFEGYRSSNAVFHESAVAYEEKTMLALFERHGLRVKPPVQYGSWCGRKQFLSTQDIIIAARA